MIQGKQFLKPYTNVQDLIIHVNEYLKSQCKLLRHDCGCPRLLLKLHYALLMTLYELANYSFFQNYNTLIIGIYFQEPTR